MFKVYMTCLAERKRYPKPSAMTMVDQVHRDGHMPMKVYPACQSRQLANKQTH